MSYIHIYGVLIYLDASRSLSRVTIGLYTSRLRSVPQVWIRRKIHVAACDVTERRQHYFD